MGVYRSAIITSSGESLISQALTGGSFLFSSAKASSYAYPQGTDIRSLTDLQDVQQTVIPSSVEVFNDTVVQVSARFSNEDVASKYFIQTIGLFAKLDSGEETLIAVVQATTPDEMPAQSAVSPSAFIYNIQMTVQQASQISITVNPAGTATVEDVASKVAKSGGDISDTIVQTIVTSETEYPMPAAGDNAKTILGKIIKFFTDIKSTVIGACYIGQLVTNTATNNDYLPAAASAVYKNAQEISKLNAETLQKGFGAATTISCGPQQGCTYSDILDIPTGSKAYIYPRTTNAPNNDPGIVEVTGYSRNSFYFLITNSNPPQAWVAVKHEIDGFTGWQQL